MRKHALQDGAEAAIPLDNDGLGGVLSSVELGDRLVREALLLLVRERGALACRHGGGWVKRGSETSGL